MDRTDSIRSIYLDYCATTPTDPRVLEAMLPFFSVEFGNPSSINHAAGRRAAEAVENARNCVSALAGCTPEEVIWTSGATEANNLALKGLRRTDVKGPLKIVTQATEHRAILDPCNSLNDFAVLGVDGAGRIDLSELKAPLASSPTVVSIMAANNETGVLFPLAEIAELCIASGALLHSDASQIFGKLPLETKDYDLLSVSSHKLYGPKGAGALIFKRRRAGVRLHPLLEGGGQERGIRSGTLNVPAIVGFGEACKLAAAEMTAESQRTAQLRDHFESIVCGSIQDVVVNGGDAERLPNVSNLGFCGVDAESLVLAMPEIAISTGSACTSASLMPSHVLRAMNLPDDIQRGSVRISFGRPTCVADVDQAAAEIIRAVRKLRELASAW